jgi:hypothetical protein
VAWFLEQKEHSMATIGFSTKDLLAARIAELRGHLHPVYGIGANFQTLILWFACMKSEEKPIAKDEVVSTVPFSCGR